MSDKEFRYRVTVDTRDVARATAEVRRAFSGLPNQVSVGGPVASPVAGRPGATSRPGTFGMDPIKAVLGFSIAGYGAMQLTQLVGQLGQLGAANLRTQQSFEGLAEGANMASESLLGRLRSATQGVVTDQRLMASSNMLLLSAQSGQIQATEKQIETLAKFARLRATQLGVGTEEAYSRLVFGITKREVELIDELGISPKSIADALNVPLQSINRNTNDFFQGIVKVAEQDIAKFGDPALDDAAKLEQATKQMEDAWNKLAIASAKPVAFTVTLAADAVEGTGNFFDFVKTEWDHITNDALQEIAQALRDRGVTPLGSTFIVAPRAANDPETKSLADAYGRLGDMRKAAFAELPDAGQGRTAELSKLTALVTGLGDAYIKLTGMQEAGVFDAGTLSQAETSWQAIAGGVEDGTLELDDANAKARELLATLNLVAAAAGNFGPQLGSSLSAAIPSFLGENLRKMQAQGRQNAVVAGNVPVDQLTEVERKYRMAVGDVAEQTVIVRSSMDDLAVGSDEAYAALIKLAGLGEQADATNERTAQEIRDKATGLRSAQLGLNMAQTDTGGQVALLEAYRQTLAAGSVEDLNTQERIAGLQSRMIEDSRQEWRQTAQEWRQTAKDVEQMFENAADRIMGIPGVTSITPVTPQDVTDTKAGVYVDKPDEWRRRAHGELEDFTRDVRTDEYGNTTETIRPRPTTDYPDVTREQVERITGMAPGTPHDVMLPKLDRMWESGSVFADPANLGLMNMDAIRGQVEEMKAGAVGRKNQQKYIMEQLNISQADAALITGQQAPIVQMLTGGQSNEEIAAQLGGVGALVNQAILAPQTVTTSPSPLISMYTGGLTADEMSAQLEAIGTTLAQRVIAPQVVVAEGQSALVRLWTGGLSAEELAAQLEGMGTTLSQRVIAPQVVVTEGQSALVRLWTGGLSGEELAAQLEAIGTTLSQRVIAPQVVVAEGQSHLVRMYTGGLTAEELAAQLEGIGTTLSQRVIAPQVVAVEGQSALVRLWTGGLSADEMAAQLEGIGTTLSQRVIAPQVVLTDGQAPLVRMFTGGLTADELGAQLEGIGTTLSQRVIAPWMVATGPSPIAQMLTGGLSGEEIAAQMEGLEGLGSTITERVLAPLQSGGLVRALSDGWAVDVRDNIKLMYGPIDSLADAVNERLDKKIGDGLKIVDIVVARVLEEIAADL